MDLPSGGGRSVLRIEYSGKVQNTGSGLFLRALHRARSA